MLDQDNTISTPDKPTITHSVEEYDTGYVVKDQTHFIGDDPVRYKTAYTSDGHCYIGTPDFTDMLCKERGIKPQLIDHRHSTCSIGFCEKESKWYGWSHRAMFGFGVGAKVVKGDVAYTPSNLEDAIEKAITFWTSDYVSDVSCDGVIRSVNKDKYILITTKWLDDNHPDIDTLVPNKAMRGTTSTRKWYLPKEYGHGEWTAETLDDAKQMAIDYAHGCS